MSDTAKRPPPVGLPALRTQLGEPFNLYGCGPYLLGWVVLLTYAGLLRRVDRAGWLEVAAWAFGGPILAAAMSGILSGGKLTWRSDRAAWALTFATAAVVYGLAHPWPAGGPLLGVSLVALLAMDRLAARTSRSALARWGFDAAALPVLERLPADLPPAVESLVDTAARDYQTLRTVVLESWPADLRPHGVDLLDQATRTFLGLLDETALMVGRLAPDEPPPAGELARLDDAATGLSQALEAARRITGAGAEQALTALRRATAEVTELGEALDDLA